MASRFIVHFVAEKNGNSYEGERKIVAETSREAEAEFRREYPGVDGNGWSRTVTYTEQDYEPLSPYEEESYNKEKKMKQEEDAKRAAAETKAREEKEAKEAEERAAAEEEKKQLQGRIPELKKARERIAKYQGCISAGSYHTVGLKTNGRVVAVGDNEYGQRNVSGWRNIVAVAAGRTHTVGLKADGTVVAVGDNKYGQCNVSGWRDIVAVAVGYDTVGLKADGTVVTAKEYDAKQVSGWRDIVAIAVGDKYIVGLKADGTVVASGYKKVSSWHDIVAVAAYDDCMGLKADGTVVSANMEYLAKEVSGWRDIVAVAVGNFHVVGLKTDGTVVSAASIQELQRLYYGWSDIVTVAAGDVHTVGLRANGTVVAVGKNKFGQCNVSGWRDIGPVPEDKTKKMSEKAKKSSERAAAREKMKWPLLIIGIFLQLGVTAAYLFILWGTDIVNSLWLENAFLRLLPLAVFSVAVGIISVIFLRRLGDGFGLYILMGMILIQAITASVWTGNVGFLLINLIGRGVLNIISIIPGAILVAQEFK
jgi:alpha-tubulin suppressor-like RCC1 family protein